MDVYGSLEELKADFGDYPREADGNINMHRPWIDNWSASTDDPTGKSHMHRPHFRRARLLVRPVPMSFAVPPPRSRTREVRTALPADHIVEYIGQTRRPCLLWS